MEPADKGRVPFFYAIRLLLVTGMVICAFSCAHSTRNQLEAKRAASDQETSASRGGEPTAPVEGRISSGNGKKYARRDVDDLEFELERAQTENALLREENNWLRTELNRLQQSLTDANQTIYSLTRKLDAIFKPNSPAQ